MLQMIGCALLAAVNLLQNPSFEDWPDGEPLPKHWQSYNEKAASSRISRLEAVGTDGEYALRYTNAGLDHSVYTDASHASSVREEARVAMLGILGDARRNWRELLEYVKGDERTEIESRLKRILKTDMKLCE